MESNKKSVKIVVLGDIGRSPRMQYHALSLLNAGFKVKIIAYLESKPLEVIMQNQNVCITKLLNFPLCSGPKILLYLPKALWQVFTLLYALVISGSCDYLLCQNPPAIPTLPVSWLYCLFTKTRFYIDWHNYAYSIMALALGGKHQLVNISKTIERYYGRKSLCNFCVTKAMKEDLLTNWNIKATILYDRPPKIFKSISVEEKHEWFQKLSQQYPEFGAQKGSARTAFTELVNGEVLERIDRPALLFSSTSWTPDEDFSILLSALEEYEVRYAVCKNLPKLICVITGKGPLKQYYTDIISSRQFAHVHVVTPWLEAGDYPLMVGSASLGVCLHTSSSGLDLPMKVVDMFGAGLPVAAAHYPCIEELVINDVNGYTFKTKEELAHIIVEWFTNFPVNKHQNKKAETMRNSIKEFQALRWEQNWDTHAKPYFCA